MRKILSLVLLLTYNTATFAGSAFTLCISPRGDICVDAIWITCTCCEHEDFSSENKHTYFVASAVQNQEHICDSQTRCLCHLQHNNRLTTTNIHNKPTHTNADISSKQPCQCKRIPLIDPQDNHHTLVESALADVQHIIDSLVSAPVISNLSRSLLGRKMVVFRPQPSTSNFQNIVSCVILRC